MSTRPLETREPLRLAPEGAAWIVLDGFLDVFFVPAGPDGIHGPRQHLFRAGAGDLLAGLPPESPEGGTLIARGNALVRETTLESLAALPPEQAVAQALDSWIRNLSEVLARPIQPKPAADVLLPASGVAGKTVAPADGVLWLSGGDGPRLFLGMEDIPPGDFLFPLTPATWLKMDDRGDVETRRTLDVLGRPEIWAGLRVFHRVFRACQAANASFERVDEFLKIRDFLSHSERSVENAVRKLDDVMRTGTAVATASRTSHEPMIEACSRVAEACGISIVVPKGFRPELYRDPLTALLQAAGIRYRKVTLAGHWYRQDNGPLLAFRAADRHPVALIPEGTHAYRAHAPGEGSTPLTEDGAASLAREAWEFHRPFPDARLCLRDIIRFGLEGSGRDLVWLLLAGLAAAVAGFLPPLLTGALFEYVIPVSSRTGLLLILAAMMLGGLSLGLLTFARGMALVRLEARLDVSIQAAVWDRLLRLPAAFFRRYTVGDLAARAGAMRTIRAIVSGAVINSLLSGIFSVANLALMAVIAPRLLPWAALLLAGFIGALLSAVPTQVRLQRESQTLRQRLGGWTYQFLQGLFKLRAAGAEGMAFAAWADSLCALRKLQWRLRSLERRWTVVAAGFPALASAVLFYRAAQDYAAHLLSLGAFLAFVAAFTATATALVSLAHSWQQALPAGPALEAMRPLLDSPPEEAPGEKAYSELRGGVEVSGVTFRYAAGTAPVLQRVSLRAEPGDFIAIVGPSGSGKSTLLRILLGLDWPETGSVYYDGRDLAGLDLSGVRRQIGTVLQNGRLIAGTVLTNILGAGADLTEEDAWAAARLAGIDEDIRRMPMRMATLLTDGGSTLSGGQRQRILIARALVRRPRILLLDEATSALDNRAQAVISASLRRMKVTRIVVAHRLSTVMEANRIVVLNQGRVEETGTYRELMASGGMFASLAARQLV